MIDYLPTTNTMGGVWVDCNLMTMWKAYICLVMANSLIMSKHHGICRKSTGSAVAICNLPTHGATCHMKI